MEDVRDLGNGFTARKWPSERQWRLVKGGREFTRRDSIRKLKDWLAARAEWRAGNPDSVLMVTKEIGSEEEQSRDASSPRVDV